MTKEELFYRYSWVFVVYCNQGIWLLIIQNINHIQGFQDGWVRTMKVTYINGRYLSYGNISQTSVP